MQRTSATYRPAVRWLICLSLITVPVAAGAWNQATHAYIADRLGAYVGHDNLDEMWGSVTPDLANYIFDPALCSGWISDQTHGMESDTFLKVWNAASAPSAKAFAYGFVTHNEAWGADHVAHKSSLTLGNDEGYVIIKAKALLASRLDEASPHPTFGEAFAARGMGGDVALLVAHVLTEYAIDIRLTNDVDPLLGRKLATAARGETHAFADLLVSAFGAEYAASCFGGDLPHAASALAAIEERHRQEMIFLGEAISQPEPVAVHLLAQRLVGILAGFLGASPPSDTREVLEAAMVRSMELCDGYAAEIEATIGFVAENLAQHGIEYPRHGPPGPPGRK